MKCPGESLGTHRNPYFFKDMANCYVDCCVTNHPKTSWLKAKIECCPPEVLWLDWGSAPCSLRTLPGSWLNQATAGAAAWTLNRAEQTKGLPEMSGSWYWLSPGTQLRGFGYLPHPPWASPRDPWVSSQEEEIKPPRDLRRSVKTSCGISHQKLQNSIYAAFCWATKDSHDWWEKELDSTSAWRMAEPYCRRTSGKGDVLTAILEKYNPLHQFSPS